MKVMKLLGGFLTVILGAFVVVGVVKHQEVADWWLLRGYTPSAQIAAIAADTTMTSKGKTIFYVHNPRIEDKAQFNQDCTFGETSIVLGCYDGRGIYVYNVSDDRLAGIHEVTAAHEMLHAAYDRLSEQEKKRVNTLTERALQKVTSERIQNLVKSYRSRSAGAVPNELHSIIGTEIENLDPELEAYYAQYFNDRKTVVALSQKYEQVFTDLKTQVERFDAELSLMKAQVTQEEAALADDNDALKAQKKHLDALFASNNINGYNAAVGSYNQKVQEYNQSIEVYKKLIADYNAKVVARNAVTVEQNDLIKSIDSKAEEL